MKFLLLCCFALYWMILDCAHEEIGGDLHINSLTCAKCNTTRLLIPQFSSPFSEIVFTGSTKIPPDIPPSCMYRPLPNYPERERLEGTEGVVPVCFLLDDRGYVTGVHLVKSSGNDAFDIAALRAALNTRWLPAEFMGNPIPCKSTFVYRFTLCD